MPPAGASTPSLLKFADRVHKKAEQIFVAHGGGLHPSLERVVVFLEAHDVQGDAPDGGEALRPAQGPVPRSVLVHDDVQNPAEAVLDLTVVAGELQRPLRRDLRAHDVVADGSLLLALPLADRLDLADGLEAGPAAQFLQPTDICGDPVTASAFLDRLLHHDTVIRIEGASYRLRQHADLILEHVREN